MMNAKHTPGPWRAFPAHAPSRKTPNWPESERQSQYDHWKIADDDQTAGNPMCPGNLVAHIYNHNGTVEANARLISAAPELLDAAIALVAHWDGLPDAVRREANAADLGKFITQAREAIAKAEGRAA
jgi:hypothetical protein